MDAVPDAHATWLEQQWETTRLKLQETAASEYTLAVNEIQKIPNRAETVKQCWDTDTRNGLEIKVILLGSSRLLLQHGMTESLTGRIEMTNHAGPDSYDLSYWREHNAEVDFILHKGNKIIAIEVKSGYAKPPSGILVFQKQYQNVKPVLVGDQGLPWQTFLGMHPQDLF